MVFLVNLQVKLSTPLVEHGYGPGSRGNRIYIPDEDDEGEDDLDADVRVRTD